MSFFQGAREIYPNSFPPRPQLGCFQPLFLVTVLHIPVQSQPQHKHLEVSLTQKLQCVLLTVELPLLTHACGPDCLCWQRPANQQLQLTHKETEDLHRRSVQVAS